MVIENSLVAHCVHCPDHDPDNMYDFMVTADADEEEQSVARGEVSLDGSHAELHPDVLRKEEVVVS